MNEPMPPKKGKKIAVVKAYFMMLEKTRETPHVSFEAFTERMNCAHCGNFVHFMGFPIEEKKFDKIANDFIDLHKDCKQQNDKT